MIQYEKIKLDGYPCLRAKLGEYFEVQIFDYETRFVPYILATQCPEFVVKVGVFFEVNEAKKAVLDFLRTKFYVL